jgi:hypothetical protein
MLQCNPARENKKEMGTKGGKVMKTTAVVPHCYIH